MAEPVVLQAMTPEIRVLVQQYARGTLGFRDLCAEISRMGYGTGSLYEMVRAEQQRIAPYPWCHTPSVCAPRGYCRRDPNCGE